jgi:hypothetical protein
MFPLITDCNQIKQDNVVDIHDFVDRYGIDGQAMIYKPLHRKIKIDQREPNLKPGCSVRVMHSCSTCGICHVTLVTNPMTSHA